MSSTNNTVTVRISSEVDTLGPDANQADLDTYAANLAAHLTHQFGVDVDVEQVAGHPRGSQRCSRDDISEYVEELHRGDGWVDFLGDRA